jgi:hypothetical protein
VKWWTLLLLLCLLPPSPKRDTPNYRLKKYWKKPDVEFCYKWDPDLQVRRLRWIIAHETRGFGDRRD